MYDVDTRQPMKFQRASGNMSTKTLIDTIVRGFTGLHYSTTAIAPHTAFAVTVGTTRNSMLEKLNQVDARFGDAWAIDTNSDSMIARLVRTLHFEFTRSTTRNTDTPLVEPVEVNVQGPGPAAAVTLCTVSGKGVYVYRTDHYWVIEKLLITRLHSTISQSFSAPLYTNCIGSMIQARPESINSIKKILSKIKAGGESAVIKLMLGLTIIDKHDRETARARDRRTLTNLQLHIQASIEAVLRLPLRGR